MTVKMCIKPFPAPINQFSEHIGQYRSFNRPLEDKHLRLIKHSNFKKRKDMPKKPPMRAVVIESASNATNNLQHSIVKLNGNRYGLRAASERISSRKDKDFIYDDDVEQTSASKVQVKNEGGNLTFYLPHGQNQEEEREGGIFEAIPKPAVVEYNSEGLKDKIEHPVDVKNTCVANKPQSTNKFHSTGRSEKASAGTTAFVQILLHTLSCSASCQQPSCRKMGMVLKHYHSCQEKRRKEAISRASLKNSEVSKEDNQGSNTPPKCSLCQQFAKIVAQHSMYLCNMSPTETGCPVPMCDMMRKLRDLRKSSLEPVPMQT
jgi:hypothetical protein